MAELGLFYEDFETGQYFQHPLGRTISEVDNTWFTLLTMNTNQMHFNDHYAKSSEFNKLLVVSTLTLSIVVGISVVDISQNAIANLGWDNIRLVHPVFVGDTLYADSTVTNLRESKSRPHAGIVSVHTRGINQEGIVCLSFDRSVMVYKRGASGASDYFPKVNPES